MLGTKEPEDELGLIMLEHRVEKWFQAMDCLKDKGDSMMGNGEGNGTPLQYSCLENPMDRGAWWATVHGVSEDSDMTEVT